MTAQLDRDSSGRTFRRIRATDAALPAPALDHRHGGGPVTLATARRTFVAGIVAARLEAALPGIANCPKRHFAAHLAESAGPLAAARRAAVAAEVAAILARP